MIGVEDLDVSGKRVLVRVDFNVPMDGERIVDDTRIRAALPTIELILEKGGQVVLMSHLGRPKGKVVPELRMAPIEQRLKELLGDDSRVVLLENLRFDPGEENPGEHPEFVKKLAEMGDCYVNDAFGTAHRWHASTAAVAEYFPGKKAAGLLMEKEVAFLGEAIANPRRPFVALIGGAKVSSKLGVLKTLAEKVDLLMIGGGMAYTFLKAQGKEIGTSLLEEELVDEAKEILASSDRILLPTDFRVTTNFDEHRTEVVREIPAAMMGVDIGPETSAAWAEQIGGAGTALWNGPVGVFEIDAFAAGTRAMAEAMAESSATTIVGGGDSVAAVQSVADKIDHISTGGGASLEYIEKGTLPGLEALQ